MEVPRRLIRWQSRTDLHSRRFPPEMSKIIKNVSFILIMSVLIFSSGCAEVRKYIFLVFIRRMNMHERVRWCSYVLMSFFSEKTCDSRHSYSMQWRIILERKIRLCKVNRHSKIEFRPAISSLNSSLFSWFSPRWDEIEECIVHPAINFVEVKDSRVFILFVFSCLLLIYELKSRRKVK